MSLRNKINLHHQGEEVDTDRIYFTQGIFQGDSLSPLFFCLALVKLSNILKRARENYELRSRKKGHILYMDDIKMFAENEKVMKECRKIVTRFRLEIEMSFGMDKCAVINTTKGKIIRSLFIY